MRESVSSSKGVLRGFTGNLLPREGSRLRTAYDLLYQNRGQVVDLSDFDKASHTEGMKTPYRFSRYYAQLNNFYGMDIRMIARQRYCLCGRWEGSKYIDYVAMRAGRINLDEN